MSVSIILLLLLDVWGLAFKYAYYVCWYIILVWSGPFQIFVALFFLYNTMGPSVGAGVAVLILAIPLNTFIAGKMRKYQKTQMGNKDARVKLMVSVLMKNNKRK
jgi:membrane protein YdbS with pleckstrin-like domain